MHVQPFVPQRYCNLPPIGGAIGPLQEHFIVEEIPAYLPSGEGEHLYLWVEKQGLNTADVAKRIALCAQFPQRDVGFAGMKDKHAITRQWFSLVRPQDDTDNWDLGEGLRILQVSRHKNKLRTGHLIGNRFEITLLGVPDADVKRATGLAGELSRTGYPNYFGPQRFGLGGRNLARALSWLDALAAGPGETATRSSKRSRDKGRFDSKMLSSVLQSEVFNRYVDARLRCSEPLLLGEVVRLSGAGAHFVIEDLTRESSRYRSGDFVLTGPMFGPKGLKARDEALALEEQVLAEAGMSADRRRLLERHAPGTRRDLMLLPEELTVENPAPSTLLLRFSLPAGAYATGLVREFTDCPWDEPRGPGG